MLLCPKNACQRSVNNFCPYILENAWAVRQHETLIEISAAFQGNNGFNSITAMS